MHRQFLENGARKGRLHRGVLLKLLRMIIGIGLAIFLIYFTVRSMGANVWEEILWAQKHYLVLATLFFGLSLAIPIYRWNLLLKVQEIYLGWWDLIKLTMIGVFFNLAIPGTVSGDLVKMVYLARQTKGRRTEAVLTVVLDRTLGLIGLFIVSGIMVLLYLPTLLELGQGYRSVQVAAYTTGVVSMFGIFALLIIKYRRSLMKHSWIDQVFAFAECKFPQSLVATCRRVASALELYANNPKVIGVAIGLSILTHSCLAFNLFLVGLSIGESSLKIGDYFLATQVSTAISSIPATPGGIGIRDVTIAMFFSALHGASAKYGALPVILTLIITFWRLLGGLFFIASKFPVNKEVDLRFEVGKTGSMPIPKQSGT